MRITQRQKQVFDLCESGLSYRQVADQLGLSRNTIKDYMRYVHAAQQWCKEHNQELRVSPNPPSVHIPIGRGKLKEYNKKRGF